MAIVFRLDPNSDDVPVIDGTSIPYATEISIDVAMDSWDSQIEDDDGFYEFVMGGKRGSGSLTCEVPADSVTMLASLIAGLDGAGVFYPAGNTSTYQKLTFVRIATLGLQQRYTSNGAVQTAVIPFKFTGYEAVAATGS